MTPRDSAAATNAENPFLHGPATDRPLRLLRERTGAPAGDGSAALIGDSRAIAAVREEIERVAPTEAPVLIEGESGTGKEVVAQAIHERSARRAAPLVPVNCGAIPEALIESELFGHERGSFTGAAKTQEGILERAHGGTLFLDEITEMPVALQVKLLRALETQRIQRVGGVETIATDVRVVAATNRSPAAAIRDGHLREDLYFRLAVFPIRLPPLREREGDVVLLADRFLDALNERHGTEKRWAAGALEELARRPWRGNVRELKNAVQRAFILASDELHTDAQRAAPREGGGGRAGEGATFTLHAGVSIAEAERALIRITLDATRGGKPEAARILGISLKTLYNRLHEYEQRSG
jgi:DNA-binding NtrC family response regulator